MSTNNVETSSVWGHSSKIGGNRYVIFSHNHPGFMERTLENLGVSFKKVKGCYKGVEETAFVINYDNYTQTLENLLTHDCQESILVLGTSDARDKRPAELVFLESGQRRGIGLMQSVSEEEAKAQDAWTYDKLQNKYFICK